MNDVSNMQMLSQIEWMLSQINGYYCSIYLAPVASSPYKYQQLS